MLVLTLLGYLYGLGTLLALGVGLSFFMSTKNPLAAEAAVIAGTLYTAGWVLLPLLFSTQEGTVDPAKLAPFLAPTRRLAWALIVIILAGVAGIYLALILVTAGVGWGLYGGALASILGVVGALAGAFTGFVWGKVLTAYAARFQLGRRAKERAGIAAFVVLLVVFAPLGIWISIAAENLHLSALEQVYAVIQWTPFGAPWALPAAASAGNGLQVLGLAGVTATSIGLGWWAWLRVLPAAMHGRAHPVTPEAEAAITGGLSRVPGAKTAPDRTARQTLTAKDYPLLHRAEQWIRLGISRPAAAIAARTEIYWTRDPRLLVQLIGAALVVFVALFAGRLLPPEEAGTGPSAAVGAGLLVLGGFVLGQVVGLLLQYDSTALWIGVAAGTPGRADRLGRILGSAGLVAVFVVLGPVAFGILNGLNWAEILAAIGAQYAAFSAAVTATSLIGSQWVYPVPPPGASPLASKGTGEFWASLLVGMGQMTLGAALTLPAVAAGALILWKTDLASWGFAASGLLALVWGTLVIWVGVRVAGKVLDGSLTELLAKISDWPGHRLHN